MGRESLWLVYIYVHPKVCHSFHYPVSPLPLASLFSSHYQRSIIIMRNSSAERGGGRGGGGATTTLNFTSKLNPAEVKWRHGSFVRAFRFEPWYYRGGKRSNNIISINRFPRRVNYWTVRINRDLRRGEEEEEEEGNV